VLVTICLPVTVGTLGCCLGWLVGCTKGCISARTSLRLLVRIMLKTSDVSLYFNCLHDDHCKKA